MPATASNYRQFLLAIICLWVLSAQAFSLTINSDDDSIIALTPVMHWYQDNSQRITVDELVAGKYRQRFQRHRDNTFNLGFSPDPVWFTVQLQFLAVDNSTQPTEQPWLLNISHPQLDLIDIYSVRTIDGRSEISHIQLGDSLPFTQRPYQYRHFLTPITFAPGEIIDIYIRVISNGPIVMPLSISSSSSAFQQLVLNESVFGIYFGIMIAMILYNLFIYASTRESSYLYYILYISSFTAMQASLSGHLFSHVWPQATHWVNLSVPVFIILSCFTAVQFSREFLLLKNNAPRLNQILILFATAALLLMAGLFILPYTLVAVLSIGLALLVTLSIILSAIICINKNNVLARFFLLGWGCLLPGAIIQALSIINILPTNFFTSHAGMMGSVIEVIVLSFALADRINHMRRENRTITETSHLNKQRINEELNQTLEKLQQGSRLKDQFLTTISHELRTPMNGVEGSLELIDTAQLNPTQRRYIETAKLSGKEMTKLIDSILRFSEIQSGELKLKHKPLDLRALLNPEVMGFRQQSMRKELSFDWYISKDLPARIKGDSDQILFIVSQLVDNAIKFTHQGGVKVIVDSQTHKDSREQTLSFSIADTGNGIASEQLGSIFNAFQQLDGNDNRSYSGLGIGLATCHQAAGIMGGEIRVDSTLGTGTEFIFSLPLISCEDTDTLNDNRVPVLSGQQKTILIAEDNPVNQLVLLGMLKPMNCILLTASNGAEVYQLLESQPVDLIMMDCQMPIVDGFEATEKIRSSRAVYSNIPIIAVTANALTSDSQRCASAGMNDYIKKPIQRDIVIEKVQHWLEKGKLAAI